ncbi:hypothetical protein HOH87_00415 [bacterium]|nr:hypothetical protein [bacterium]
MESFSHLEVDIKKLDTQLYEATCPAFSKCKGSGISANDALKQLSQAIADYISEVAGDAFKTLLTSDQYSEVIIDTTSTKKEQKRVFDLDPSLIQFTKTLAIKVKAADLQLPHKISRNDIQELLNPTERGPMSVAPTGNIIDPTIQKAAQGNPEGFVFGFPLSFN